MPLATQSKKNFRAGLVLGAAVLAGQLAVLPPASAAPTSTSSCSGTVTTNGSTCFTITGTGLHVSSVSSTFEWSKHPGTCQTLHITVTHAPSGGAYNFFPFNQQTCADSDIWQSGNINFNESFPNGTVMCAVWASGSPKICHTIHT